MNPKVEITSAKFRDIQELMFAVTILEITAHDQEKLLCVYKKAIQELENILEITFYHKEDNV